MSDLTKHWVTPRYKAALKRHKLSSPIEIAIAKGVLTPDHTILDYGCGQGGDVFRLAAMGYDAVGFDPYWQPDTHKRPSDVVCLNYVLGVIESPKERQDVLKEAWFLANQILIVSSQVQNTRGKVQYGDGWLSKWGIFTKYWTEPEWRGYVESVTGAKAKRIGKGILYVCKPQPVVVSELLAA